MKKFLLVLVVIIAACGGGAAYKLGVSNPVDLFNALGKLDAAELPVASETVKCCGLLGPAVSTPMKPVARTSNVLFIGNSFTYVNDLPGTVGKIAASDPANDVRYRLFSVTLGGSTLSDQWEKGEGRDELASLKPEFLVLQDNSLWAMKPETVRQNGKAMENWVAAARSVGSKAMFYVTWPYKARSHFYLDSDLGPVLRTPENMAAVIDYESRASAAHVSIPAVMIGDFWSYVARERPGLDLYNADGYHPSKAGTYLTALLFYRTFSGNKPDQVTFVPDGISADDAAFLRKVASM